MSKMPRRREQGLRVEYRRSSVRLRAPRGATDLPPGLREVLGKPDYLLFIGTISSELEALGMHSDDPDHPVNTTHLSVKQWDALIAVAFQRIGRDPAQYGF